jgi:ribonuclease R
MKNCAGDYLIPGIAQEKKKTVKNDRTKPRIIQILTENEKKPMTAGDISAALELRGAQRKRLQKLLSTMVAEGDIVVIRRNRYCLGAPADLQTGVLDVVRSGNGYLTPKETGESVFVASGDMGVALPGDRVVVRLYRPAHGNRRGLQGKVIRVIDRIRRDIVGTLKSTGRFLYAVPIDPAYHKDFYVQEDKGAKIDDRVVVRFTGWQNVHVNPEGEIIEVLGPADNPAVDTLSVIRQNRIRDEFSPEVMREVESVSALMDDPGTRQDLTSRLVLTIDPERARDFDDALSLEKDENGNRVLGVHIADVSHFVRPGSGIDEEAYKRGNSVYLPDKVIPMLPEQLSNGICSLGPAENRLAFSAFLTVDAKGTVIGRRFAKTIIRSRCRLTYEEALSVLENRERKDLPESLDNNGKRLLRDLNRMAQQWRKRRFARNALQLDVPECEIVMGDDSRMTGIRAVGTDVSHQLVEECMIAANEAVAAELAGKKIPLISRLHEAPGPDKIEDLAAELVEMGYSPGNLGQRRNLAAFLRSVTGDPLEHHVKIAVLKKMKRALYSSDDTGHYGLAKKFYAHFTSPIRRYPDLVVHRQLQAFLLGSKLPYNRKALARISMLCSETEQVAEKAERDVIEIKKYRYLQQQIDEDKLEIYDAVVAKVVNFGMFVEVPGLMLQGMVHISAISDKFVRYSRRNQTLRAGSNVYKLGAGLRVSPARVDFDKRQIDFSLAKKRRGVGGNP